MRPNVRSSAAKRAAFQNAVAAVAVESTAEKCSTDSACTMVASRTLFENRLDRELVREAEVAQRSRERDRIGEALVPPPEQRGERGSDEDLVDGREVANPRVASRERARVRRVVHGECWILESADPVGRSEMAEICDHRQPRARGATASARPRSTSRSGRGPGWCDTRRGRSGARARLRREQARNPRASACCGRRHPSHRRACRRPCAGSCSRCRWRRKIGGAPRGGARGPVASKGREHAENAAASPAGAAARKDRARDAMLHAAGVAGARRNASLVTRGETRAIKRAAASSATSVTASRDSSARCACALR